MKILVFSDSHGDMLSMKAAVSAQKPQTVLHLGDGAEDFALLAAGFPKLDMRGVRGNCDISRPLPPESLYFTIEDKNVYMTHGHIFNVKFGYERILFAALEKKADILLFGHTHKAYRDTIRGIEVLNPGSIGERYNHSYGIIEISEGNIEISFKKQKAGD